MHSHEHMKKGRSGTGAGVARVAGAGAGPVGGAGRRAERPGGPARPGWPHGPGRGSGAEPDVVLRRPDGPRGCPVRRLGRARRRPARGGRPWGRARRGDVRSAILALLAERPMHGYEIIGELSDRTEGLWRPSPGSIYPTLQLLEDEGLVTVQPDDAGGKKRFSLTEEGRRAAAEVAKGQAPWEAGGSRCPGRRPFPAPRRRPAHARCRPSGDERRAPGVRGSRQDHRRSSPAPVRRAGRRPGARPRHGRGTEGPGSGPARQGTEGGAAPPPRSRAPRSHACAT